MFRWLRRLFGSERRHKPATIVRGGRPSELPSSWLPSLPSRVVAVDIETTGLTAADRIVSLAAILVDTRDLAAGGFDLKHLHIVVDPGRPSHPEAERVHGYADQVLRA